MACVKTRGIRNCNPGNLIKSTVPYVGKVLVSTDSKFEQFSDIKYGVRALLLCLLSYYRMHHCNTIFRIINRFAPVVENNTTSYVRFVCSFVGVSQYEAIDLDDRDILFKLAAAICKFESNYVLSRNDFDLICKTL